MNFMSFTKLEYLELSIEQNNVKHALINLCVSRSGLKQLKLNITNNKKLEVRDFLFERFFNKNRILHTTIVAPSVVLSVNQNLYDFNIRDFKFGQTLLWKLKNIEEVNLKLNKEIRLKFENQHGNTMEIKTQ